MWGDGGSRFTYLLVHEGLKKGEEKHGGAGWVWMQSKSLCVCRAVKMRVYEGSTIPQC
jgi:hypothetical protein